MNRKKVSRSIPIDPLSKKKCVECGCRLPERIKHLNTCNDCDRVLEMDCSVRSSHLREAVFEIEVGVI